MAIKSKTAAPSKPAAKAVVPAAPQANALQANELNEAARNALMEGAESDIDSYSKAEVAIPFLQVLQPLSPQVDKSHAAYVEGAEPGMIINTVTKELFNSIDVVVVYAKRSFIEWVPRSKGGGFRGERGLDFEPEFDRLLQESRDRRAAKGDRETGRAENEAGNEILDTRTFYVLTVPEEGLPSPAVISMSSTQIKGAREWLQSMRQYQPPGMPPKAYPLYAAVYRLNTVQKSNEKGRWYVFREQRLRANVNPEMINMARAFRQEVLGGAVVVDHAQAQQEESSGGSSDM